jgi:hypothetical protein
MSILFGGEGKSIVDMQFPESISKILQKKSRIKFIHLSIYFIVLSSDAVQIRFASIKIAFLTGPV